MQYLHHFLDSRNTSLGRILPHVIFSFVIAGCVVLCNPDKVVTECRCINFIVVPALACVNTCFSSTVYQLVLQNAATHAVLVPLSNPLARAAHFRSRHIDKDRIKKDCIRQGQCHTCLLNSFCLSCSLCEEVNTNAVMPFASCTLNIFLEAGILY